MSRIRRQQGRKKKATQILTAHFTLIKFFTHSLSPSTHIHIPIRPALLLNDFLLLSLCVFREWSEREREFKDIEQGYFYSPSSKIRKNAFQLPSQISICVWCEWMFTEMNTYIRGILQFSSIDEIFMSERMNFYSFFSSSSICRRNCFLWIFYYNTFSTFSAFSILTGNKLVIKFYEYYEFSIFSHSLSPFHWLQQHWWWYSWDLTVIGCWSMSFCSYKW